MAFCNSCGANLTPGTKFCNKCGAAVSGTVAAPVAPPPTAGSSSALKIILIIVGVIVLIGILGLASLSFVAHRFMAHSHVTNDGKHVKVETPFGAVETNKDPALVSKDLGIDIYPAAELQNNSAAPATFGGVHSASAAFTTSDSVDQVCAFYKSKFPSAMVTTSGDNRCTLISNDQKNMITINIESKGSVTKLQITNVSKTSGSSN
jgi:hypothetical protein